MIIISFETRNNKGTRNKKKSTFHSTKRNTLSEGRMPLQKVIKKEKKKKRTTKENPISGILGFVFEGVFLGISSLGMDVISFGLNLHVLGLKDHILNYKGVLRGLILHW